MVRTVRPVRLHTSERIRCLNRGKRCGERLPKRPQRTERPRPIKHRGWFPTTNTPGNQLRRGAFLTTALIERFAILLRSRMPVAAGNRKHMPLSKHRQMLWGRRVWVAGLIQNERARAATVSLLGIPIPSEVQTWLRRPASLTRFFPILPPCISHLNSQTDLGNLPSPPVSGKSLAYAPYRPGTSKL
jgi:hypothetical protein